MLLYRCGFQLDTDGSGEIDYDEYMRFLLPTSNFPLPTSYWPLLTSYLLLTCYSHRYMRFVLKETLQRKARATMCAPS